LTQVRPAFAPLGIGQDGFGLRQLPLRLVKAPPERVAAISKSNCPSDVPPPGTLPLQVPDLRLMTSHGESVERADHSPNWTSFCQSARPQRPEAPGPPITRFGAVDPNQAMTTTKRPPIQSLFGKHFIFSPAVRPDDKTENAKSPASALRPRSI